MNSKNSLILMIAILLVVGQLMGDDSTIVAVASSDAEGIQLAMEEGEEAIERAAAPAPIRRSASVAQPASNVSLDDFYGADAQDEFDDAIEPEITDEDPDAEEAQAVDTSRLNSSNVTPEEASSKPFDPRVG